MAAAVGQDEEVGAAHADYGRFLAEYGFSEEQVKQTADLTSDRVDMPPGSSKIELRPSRIAGDGVFATQAVMPGETLAPARIGDKRTAAGYGTNHSPNANAQFVALPNGDLQMVSRRAISAGEEVTVDYRQAGRVNGWGREPDLHELAETVRLRRLAKRQSGAL